MQKPTNVEKLSIIIITMGDVSAKAGVSSFTPDQSELGPIYCGNVYSISVIRLNCWELLSILALGMNFVACGLSVMSPDLL